MGSHQGRRGWAETHAVGMKLWRGHGKGRAESKGDTRGDASSSWQLCLRLDVSLVPLVPHDENEGNGRSLPYRASAKIDIFCSQIISFLLMYKSCREKEGKRREITLRLTVREGSTWISQIYGPDLWTREGDSIFPMSGDEAFTLLMQPYIFLEAEYFKNTFV